MTFIWHQPHTVRKMEKHCSAESLRQLDACIISNPTWLRSSPPPTPSRVMWPLAPLQISWRRGTHCTQWGSFYFQRRPGPGLQTTLSAQWALLIFLFFSPACLSFTPLPLTVQPPSLTPPAPMMARRAPTGEESERW